MKASDLQFSCAHSSIPVIQLIKGWNQEIQLNTISEYSVNAEFSSNDLYNIREKILGLLYDERKSELQKNESGIENQFHYVNRLVKMFMYDSYEEIMESIDGEKWIVNKGTYAGTWIKRLNSFLYKKENLKLSPSINSIIGGELGKMKKSGLIYKWDLTDNIDWERGDFGDDGSCFWGEKSDAIPSMLINGGLGFRFYKDYGGGLGRSWILPYRNKIIMFNGYGLELINQVRILSSILGISYKKIDWNNQDRKNVLWINNDEGYILGEIDEIQSITRIQSDYEVIDGNLFTCSECGQLINGDSYYVNDFGDICTDCYESGEYSSCEHCGNLFYNDDTIWIESEDSCWCTRCLNQYFSQCSECGEYVRDSNIIHSDFGVFCESCYQDNICTCENCDSEIKIDDSEERENPITGQYLTLCEDCINLSICEDCGKLLSESDLITIDFESESQSICEDCFNRNVRD